MDITSVLRSHGIGVGKKLKGDAQPQHVLENKTFSNQDGNDKIGTMPNRGGMIITPTPSNIVIPNGYHDGTGRVNGVIEATGNAVVGDVLAGKTFSKAGSAGLTGTMADRGTVNITPGTTNQTILGGKHSGAGVVYGSANLVPGNIKKGVKIYNVTGTLEEKQVYGGAFYWYGREPVLFVEGYSEELGGTFTRYSDYLYLETMYAPNYRSVFSINTNTPVDLTNIFEIHFYLKNTGTDLSTNSSRVGVSTSKPFHYLNRVAYISKEGAFDNVTLPVILDVSGLSGSYYIGVENFHSDKTTNRRGKISLYGINFL